METEPGVAQKKRKSGTKKKKPKTDGSSTILPPGGSAGTHGIPLPTETVPEAAAAAPSPMPVSKQMKYSGAPKQMLSLRRVLEQHAPKLSIPTPANVDAVKQVDYVLAAVPSLGVIMAFNIALKFVMKNLLGISQFPPPLVGMFIFFGTLVSMKDEDAARFVDFFEPANVLLTNFLPVFFSPGLIRTPAAAKDVKMIDFVKFVATIFVGLVSVLAQTGFLTDFIMRATGAAVPPPAPPKRGKFVPWFSQSSEIIWAVTTALTGVLALAAPPVQSLFFVAATIFSFVFAARLPRLLPPTVAKFWHPLMTTYVAATGIMGLQGMLRGKDFQQVLGEYLVPGATWDRAAGNFIMYFLEPAIIAFSFGLYRRKQLLFDNALAIFAGSFSSAFTGLHASYLSVHLCPLRACLVAPALCMPVPMSPRTPVCFTHKKTPHGPGILTMAGISRMFGVTRTLGLALMPRATAALAVVQAGMIGASTALTTVHCCIIGVLGANFATASLDLMGIKNPIARGVASGGSGLALSSAALATTDPAAFPFGTLTMSLTSTIATALFTVPSFQNLVFWVAGLSRHEVKAVAVESAKKAPWDQVLSFVQKLWHKVGDAQSRGSSS